MLNLKLRDEFLGSQMPGTAIALRRKDNTGAAQRNPDFILSITYPTAEEKQYRSLHPLISSWMTIRAVFNLSWIRLPR